MTTRSLRTSREGYPARPAWVLLALALALAAALVPGPASARDALRCPNCETLLAALALRDPATAAHAERVGALAAALAPALDLDPDLARLGGRLHDLGKLGMPDSILKGTQDRLSDAEWAAVRRHPGEGAALARRVGVPVALLPAILAHHERFDGKGYPEGLAGEAVPEIARVVAVADALDAISARRSYKAPVPFGEAVSRLRGDRGTRYDPRVIDRMVAEAARLEDLWNRLSPPR